MRPSPGRWVVKSGPSSAGRREFKRRFPRRFNGSHIQAGSPLTFQAVYFPEAVAVAQRPTHLLGWPALPQGAKAAPEADQARRLMGKDGLPCGAPSGPCPKPPWATVADDQGQVALTEEPAELVKEAKHSSSLWLKNKNAGVHDSACQNGGGIFSIGLSHVDRVRKHIADREDHHRQVTCQDEFRQWLQRCEIEFDER